MQFMLIHVSVCDDVINHIILTSNDQWMDNVRETFYSTLLTEQWLPTDSKLFTHIMLNSDKIA